MGSLPCCEKRVKNSSNSVSNAAAPPFVDYEVYMQNESNSHNEKDFTNEKFDHTVAVINTQVETCDAAVNTSNHEARKNSLKINKNLRKSYVKDSNLNLTQYLRYVENKENKSMNIDLCKKKNLLNIKFLI